MLPLFAAKIDKEDYYDTSQVRKISEQENKIRSIKLVLCMTIIHESTAG